MRNRFAVFAVLLAGLLQACCSTTKTAEVDPNVPDRAPEAAVAGWETESAPMPMPAELEPLEPVGRRARDRAEIAELRDAKDSLTEQIEQMRIDIDELEKARADAERPAEPVAAAAPVPEVPVAAPPSRPRVTVEAVREILGASSLGDLSVSLNAEGRVVVTLPGSVSFGAGKAVLMRKGRVHLQKMSVALLREFPELAVRAEGHTDSDPIRRSRWADNHELSEARAKAVADYLSSETGFTADRVEYSGFGMSRPIAAEDTRAGKARNRRVEIVLLD